jgi:hypothetical protein
MKKDGQASGTPGCYVRTMYVLMSLFFILPPTLPISTVICVAKPVTSAQEDDERNSDKIVLMERWEDTQDVKQITER